MCSCGTLMKTANFSQSNSSTSGWNVNWYPHFEKLKVFSKAEYMPNL